MGWKSGRFVGKVVERCCKVLNFSRHWSALETCPRWKKAGFGRTIRLHFQRGCVFDLDEHGGHVRVSGGFGK